MQIRLQYFHFLFLVISLSAFLILNFQLSYLNEEQSKTLFLIGDKINKILGSNFFNNYLRLLPYIIFLGNIALLLTMIFLSLYKVSLKNKSLSITVAITLLLCNYPLTKFLFSEPLQASAFSLITTGLFIFFYLSIKKRLHTIAYLLLSIITLLTYKIIGVNALICLFIPILSFPPFKVYKRISYLSTSLIIFITIIINLQLSILYPSSSIDIEFSPSIIINILLWTIPILFFVYPSFCQQFKKNEQRRIIFNFTRLLVVFFLLLSIVYDSDFIYLIFIPLIILSSFHCDAFLRRYFLIIHKILLFSIILLAITSIFISFPIIANIENNTFFIIKVSTIILLIFLLLSVKIKKPETIIIKTAVIALLVQLNFHMTTHSSSLNKKHTLSSFREKLKNRGIKTLFVAWQDAPFQHLLYSNILIHIIRGKDTSINQNEIWVLAKSDKAPIFINEAPFYYKWKKIPFLLEENKKMFLWHGIKN